MVLFATFRPALRLGYLGEGEGAHRGDWPQLSSGHDFRGLLFQPRSSKVRAHIEEIGRNFHLVMISEDFSSSLVLLRWVPILTNSLALTKVSFFFRKMSNIALCEREGASGRQRTEQCCGAVSFWPRSGSS